MQLLRERKDETHLSVFHSVSNRNSISSSARNAFNSVFFGLMQDCTTFTLHDLTDFYVERETAHRIKSNDRSCFHDRWPNSITKINNLREQRGVLGALHILRIGRIGSARSVLAIVPLSMYTYILIKCVSRFG